MKTEGKSCGRFLIAVLLLPLFATEWGSACTVVPTWIEMPPSFEVEVRDAEEAIAGLRVEVFQTDSIGTRTRRLLAGITDGRGLFEVQGLRPGDYSIVAGEGTAFKSSALVEIPRTSVWRLPRRLRMEWIESHVLRVHAFAGELRSYDLVAQSEGKSSFGEAIAGAVLIIREARSLRRVAETKTGPGGRFEALSLRKGLYAVEIKLSGADPEWGKGTFPLLVAAQDATTVGRVEVAVAFTSCGLQYVARSLEE